MRRSEHAHPTAPALRTGVAELRRALGARPWAGRFLAHVRGGSHGVVWAGACNADGYGVFRRGVRSEGVVLAHRLVFTALNGEIGLLDVHHLCGRRSCVDPFHLMALPPEVNRYGDAPTL